MCPIAHSESLTERNRMVAKSDSSGLDSSLTHLLHRACQAADSIFNDEAGKTGLTTRQFAVLLAVGRNRDISQTGLVHVTGIDRSTVAEIVKRLLKRGLLKRKRTRQDARAYAVRLTDEGAVLMRDAEPAARRAEERIRQPFSADDIAALKEALSRLAVSLPDPRP